MQFSGICRTTTLRTIDMKFCMFDYVNEITKFAKMLRIAWLGAAPEVGEIIVKCHSSI